MALAACTSSPGSGSTAPGSPGSSSAAPDHPVQFGLFVPDNPNSYAQMSAFPTHPSIAVYYSPWNDPFQANFARAAWQHGTTTLVEIQSCSNDCQGTNPTGLSLTDIKNGVYDAYLKQLAAEIKAFGHPVMVTFDHEMNGYWYAWGTRYVTPVEWILAYQHVVTVMRSVAPGIQWLWAPNVGSAYGTVSLDKYWPGSQFVDAVGLDGYPQSSADTYASVFAPSIAQIRQLTDKPLFIAETGVLPGPEAAYQVTNIIDGARQDNLSGVIWFDTGEYTLAGSTLKAFVSALNLPRAVSTTGPAAP
jgi:beta-mannanase